MTHDDDQGVLARGTRVFEFRVERLLGRGGFGATYLAWDESLESWRALKEYLPTGWRGAWGRRLGDGKVGPAAGREKEYRWGLERFVQEARVLADERLNHPHIVRVYRCFEDRGTAYLVMERVEGRSLAKALATAGGWWPESRVRPLLSGLASGLSAVHAAGLLHRDVSPANVMLRAGDDSPVLIDFGTARKVEQDESGSLPVVKAGYAAFEQYKNHWEAYKGSPEYKRSVPDGSGADQGPWTDVYGLGAVAYVALSGVVPPSATERFVNDDVLRPVAKVAGQPVSAALSLAVDAALSVLPSERPQSMGEWVSLWRNESSGASPAPPRVGRLWLYVAAAVVVTALAVASVVVPPGGDAGSRDVGAGVREPVVELAECRQALLERAATADAEAAGWTALHAAAAANYPTWAAELLAAGAAVDTPLAADYVPRHVTPCTDFDRERRYWAGDVPLHVAARSNAIETLEVLLAHNADADALAAFDATPLHVAARSNALEAAEVLLAQGSNVQARTVFGATPLDWAMNNDAAGAMAVLRSHGAAGPERRETSACRRALLEVPADVDGWTLLHSAAAVNDTLWASALLSAGVEVDARLKDDGERLWEFLRRRLRGACGRDAFDTWQRDGDTPLWVAIDDDADAGPTLDVLLAHRANVHAVQADDGKTPLHYAARNDALEIVVKLLERGADINATDDNGSTALHQAAHWNAPDVVLELLRRGADVHAKMTGGDVGDTALHQAAYSNAHEIVVMLLERGANVDARNSAGATPLHGAAYYHAREVVVELLERDADLHALDNRSRTPLDRADSGILSGLDRYHETMRELAGRLLREWPQSDEEIRRRYGEGLTALHLAALADDPQSAAELLERGADIHAEWPTVEENDTLRIPVCRTPLDCTANGDSRDVLVEFRLS